MTEQKLTELLRDMSLEEKVNQMSQVTGGFFNGEIVVTGPMADKGFTEDNVNLAGSVIGSMGAETLKSIQKNYMEKFVVVRARLKPQKYEAIKAHAEARDESINGFINRAIDETMERDKDGESNGL